MCLGIINKKKRRKTQKKKINDLREQRKERKIKTKPEKIKHLIPKVTEKRKEGEI